MNQNVCFITVYWYVPRFSSWTKRRSNYENFEIELLLGEFFRIDRNICQYQNKLHELILCMRDLDLIYAQLVQIFSQPSWPNLRILLQTTKYQFSLLVSNYNPQFLNKKYVSFCYVFQNQTFNTLGNKSIETSFDCDKCMSQ